MARKPTDAAPPKPTPAAAAADRLPDRPRRRAADVPDAYLVWATIGFVDAKVVPLIPRRYNPENVFGRNIFGLGLLVFVSFTTLVGALAKGFIGRQILQFGERIVERTPIVRSIYNGLKQIVETIFNQSRHLLPAGLPDRVSAQGPLGGRLRRHRRPRRDPGKTGEPDLVSVFLPDDAEPDHRASCSSCRAATSSARHEPRGGGEAHHLRRPRHPARPPPAAPPARWPKLAT